jgi:hypothetical protein
MNILLITGSRDYPVPNAIAEELRAVCQRADLIIVGCCPTGIDALVRAEFPNHIEFKADWRQHGKAAGPMRNQEMADLAKRFKNSGHKVFCCAFPSGTSKGTYDCADRAREAGLIVVVKAMNW